MKSTGKFWPKSKSVSPFMHGWFGHGNKEEIDRVLKSKKVKVVCELGSWYGKSAEYMVTKRKDLFLICVDLWSADDIIKGNQVIKNQKYIDMLKEHPLYSTFLANLWNYKERVMPLKMSTMKALSEIHKMGIKPDAIYIDANHTYKDVKDEIELSMKLFPKAILFGDDINWPGVKRAVLECASKYKFKVIKNRNCWRYMKKISPGITKKNTIKILRALKTKTKKKSHKKR